MVFSSLFFLFYFLPLALIFYYISPRKHQNFSLLLISLVFYALGEPLYIWIMILSTLIDYTHGLLIHKTPPGPLKKSLLISSIFLNLGLLSIFKYSDFFISSLNGLFNWRLSLLNLPLPIGISFYTFQTMSYTLDVYRGKVLPQKNLIAFGTYVTLFPQLIAGPIVTYSSVKEQLTERRSNAALFGQGVVRFVLGLGKKVLLANNIGLLFERITALSLSELSVANAWLGILAFGFQIYFDFSGYSDMAIGLGKMLGFEFPENFNYPYISQNITEFWRRWHISLSSWFRDYVYIPLGGSRVSQQRLLFNMLLTWLLTGFWHGASWNFILWGLYFGIIIFAEKLFFLGVLKKLPRAVRHIYTLTALLFGWVLFSFDNLSFAWGYGAIMLGLKKQAFIDSNFLYNFSGYKISLIFLVLFSTPLVKLQIIKFTKLKPQLGKTLLRIGLWLIFILAVAYLVDGTYNPFLYFRF